MHYRARFPRPFWRKYRSAMRATVLLLARAYLRRGALVKSLLSSAQYRAPIPVFLPSRTEPAPIRRGIPCHHPDTNAIVLHSRSSRTVWKLRKGFSTEAYDIPLVLM